MNPVLSLTVFLVTISAGKVHVFPFGNFEKSIFFPMKVLLSCSTCIFTKPMLPLKKLTIYGAINVARMARKAKSVSHRRKIVHRWSKNANLMSLFAWYVNPSNCFSNKKIIGFCRLSAFRLQLAQRTQLPIPRFGHWNENALRLVTQVALLLGNEPNCLLALCVVRPHFAM